MKKRIGLLAPNTDVVIPPIDNTTTDLNNPIIPVVDDTNTVTDLQTNPIVVPVVPVIQFNAKIKDLAIFIQCTWARVFTEPVINKGLCIRSYDRLFLKYQKLVGKQNQIGTLTGNYFVDSHKVVWLQAFIFYCDRRPTGWFRERDIWHALKGCKPNQLDWPYIPYAEDANGNVINNGTKKINWIAWLIPALTLLSNMH